jgi:hypothetical protein
LAGLDPELRDKRLSRLLVHLERLRLAPGSVEREHQLPAEALAKAMLAHQELQLGDEIGVAAEREIDLDPLLDSRQAQFLEPVYLGLRKALVGEIAQRRSAPQRQGGLERYRRAAEIAFRARGACLVPQPLESIEVELFRLEVQHVAGRTCDQQLLRVAVAAEELAQPGDVAVESGRGGPRGLFAPELLDQSVAGDDLVGVQEQKRQQRAALLSPELERTAVVAYLERAE